VLRLHAIEHFTAASSPFSEMKMPRPVISRARQKDQIVNHILLDNDPLRRKLWQIFDELRQTNGAHRFRLAERERRIRRRWLSEQSQKARAGR